MTAPGKLSRKVTLTLTEPWEGENMNGGFKLLTLAQLDWFVRLAQEEGAKDDDPVTIRHQAANRDGYELAMEWER